MQIELAPEFYARGPFDGEIILYSDDPEQPIVKVKVTAALDPPIKWKPLFVNHVVRQGQPANLPELMIVSRGVEEIGPVTVESSSPVVHVRTKALDDQSYAVSLDLDPDVTLGAVDGKIVVKTHHPQMPVVTIPMSIYIIGDLVAEYPTLEVGILAPGEPASAEINLIQQGDRPVRITRVEPQLPVACDVTIEETPTGYKLILNLTETQPLRSLEGNLRIFTDHPTQSPLEVPVEGWIAAEDPFAISGGDGTEDKIYRLLEYALYLEELLAPEEVVDDILGGHRDQRSLDLVMRAVESENWHTRQRAMQVLGQLGLPQAVETIRRAVIADPDEDVRGAAAAALVNLVGKEALPELALALQDNDELVRAASARLLGEIGDQRAVPLLLQAKNDAEELVREEAERALNKLAGKTS